MSDRVFFPAAAVSIVLMIVLALMWPQGYGLRSPWPFGHTPVMQTPEMRAAMAEERQGRKLKAILASPTPAATAGLRPHQ
jgi:hypothetical protein